MSAIDRTPGCSLARIGLFALAGALLAGCSGLNKASNSIAGIVTPYKIEIVQGNFVSKEQVDALQAGMSRNQVRDILGTPLLADIFHADRWDYVFTIKRQGVEPQARKLVLFFKGDELEKFEGDEMPTEAEFITALDVGKRSRKVPVLEAPEDSLKDYAPPAKTTETPTSTAASNPPPPLPTTYPPLEPSAR